MPDSTTSKQIPSNSFFNRLPAQVGRALSQEQRTAIAAAAIPRNRQSGQPLNIRLSVPIMRRRFYFAISGGRERRNRDRLAVERREYPLGTTGNIMFIVIGAVAFYFLTHGGFLIYSSLLGN